MEALSGSGKEKMNTLFGNVSECISYTQLLLIHKSTAGTPYDGFPDEVIHSTSTPLFVIYTLLSSIGIIFVIGCLLFNIIFRNKK